LRSSEDETSELFTGNVGSNAPSQAKILKKRVFFGLGNRFFPSEPPFFPTEKPILPSENLKNRWENAKNPWENPIFPTENRNLPREKWNFPTENRLFPLENSIFRLGKTKLPHRKRAFQETISSLSLHGFVSTLGQSDFVLLTLLATAKAT
jgi:hypothetical protein